MMLKIRLVLLVLITVLCLSSCKSDNVLSRRQLEDMLFEMHLSDGIVHTLADKMQLQSTDTIIRYKAIFEKYNCSRDKFEKSMRVYSRKRETITQIYENIKKRFDTALKDLEGTGTKDFIKNIIDKFCISLKDIFSKTGDFFENIKSTDDFVEKLIQLQKDIPENAEQDSVELANTGKFEESI
ncbi:MAG: DUF4296 domain-containing protein [Prevotellaceae bacterium]|nr:DUF4296 domain-containing protein [Prevotellaceae bacterium]